jgi:DNA-binding protein HU-beta
VSIRRQCAGNELVLVVHTGSDAVDGADERALAAAYHAEADTAGLQRHQPSPSRLRFVAASTPLEAKSPLGAGLRGQGEPAHRVVEHLEAGERVRIGGLGIIEVKNRPARAGRNPATGAIQIKASKKIAFRAAKELKDAIGTVGGKSQGAAVKLGTGRRK